MIAVILGFLFVFLFLFEWNMSVYRPFVTKPLAKYPSVSILVPARNESPHIGPNVESLLAQDYPDFEVIVLDDDSTDDTAKILASLKARHKHLRVLSGEPLPAGWTGKNRACHRLSEAAANEWLLFVDADTHHAPDGLKRAVETVVHRDAVLVSTFPRQRLASWGDALLVPLMYFVLLTYLPMYFVAKRTWRWVGDFSAACGQYMLIRKDVYRQIRGHEIIKARISEAPLIASAAKKTGGRILLLDGSRWVSCSMYKSFGEAYKGFTRSVFASMGASPVAVIFFLTLQTFMFHVPYVTLLWAVFTGQFSTALFWGSLIAIAVPLWMRFRIHQRVGMPRRFIWPHGLSILLYHIVMLNSFIDYKFRRNTSWKSRTYANPT